MRQFLRRSSVGREPLAVTMSGVRLGERALQIGLDDPRIAGLLAAKPGLSGHSVMVVADEANAVKARQAAAEAAALADIQVSSLENLPLEDGSIDVVVLHNRDGLLETLGAARSARVLAECHRVIRPGGRLVVFGAGTPSGLVARLRNRHVDGRGKSGEATVQGLEAAGFRAVRTLGDRDNYRFIEGMKGRSNGESDPSG